MPIVFAETRALAQEWTYRFLAAAVREVGSHVRGRGAVRRARRGRAGAGRAIDYRRGRVWAMEAGLPVSARGRLRP